MQIDLMSLPYFAYGSNLDSRDWKVWCGENAVDCGPLRPIMRAFALDHRLVFGKHSTGRGGGVADIRPAPGHVVEGMLFRLTPAQRAALDRKEGVAARHYEPVAITVQDEGGEVLHAMTYSVTVVQKRVHVEPHPSYLGILSRGLAERGLCPVTPWAVAEQKGRGAAPVDGVFVYGALLSGESRAAVLPVGAVRRPAAIRGRILDCGGFPGLVAGPNGLVRGEFVALDDLERVIPMLDVVEGYDPPMQTSENRFKRRLVALSGDGGAVKLAWSYRLARPMAVQPVVQSGDWMFHRGQPRLADPVLRETRFPHAREVAWALAEVARLKVLVADRPRLFGYVHKTCFDKGTFWRGADVALIGDRAAGGPAPGRDEGVATPYAAEFSGLFVLCQTVLAATDPRFGLRRVFLQMAQEIGAGKGGFADQAAAALAHIETALRAVEAQDHGGDGA